MRILIATPCHQGIVTTGYLNSIIKTISRLQGIEIAVLTMDSDSFIIRSRNNCAAFAIKEKFHKLLFIDNDLSWEPEHIVNLIESGKEVIGGTYRLKTDTFHSLNFNPLDKHFRVFKNSKKTKEEYNLYIKEYADKKGLVQVKHVPTGFLLIDVSVFEKLKNVTQFYYDGKELKGNYFPSNVVDGILESEDWGFCTLCSKAKIPIWMDTSIVLPHTGTKEYVW